MNKTILSISLVFINNTLTNIKEKKIKIKSYSYAKYTHRYNASKQNTDQADTCKTRAAQYGGVTD